MVSKVFLNQCNKHIQWCNHFLLCNIFIVSTWRLCAPLRDNIISEFTNRQCDIWMSHVKNSVLYSGNYFKITFQGSAIKKSLCTFSKLSNDQELILIIWIISFIKSCALVNTFLFCTQFKLWWQMFSDEIHAVSIVWISLPIQV